MAHKHNRRRARPRSRQNKNRKDSNSSYDSYGSYNSGFSYDSLSYTPQIILTPPEYAKRLPLGHPSFTPNQTMGLGYRYSQYIPSTTFNQITPKDAINTESQRLRMFGGEPGDDVDLCYKMVEVFEGMNWIHV